MSTHNIIANIPTIQLFDYVSKLTTITQYSESIPINICLSGGGMAGMYQSGVLAYIYSLYLQKKIKINHIYGTSAGAFSGIILLLAINQHHFDENYSMNIDKFMDIIQNKIPKSSNQYLGLVYRDLFNELLPDDIHNYCNDKLFISVNVINNSIFYERIVVSKYSSKEYLLDVLLASASVPYITIPSFFSLYSCLSTKKKCMRLTVYFQKYLIQYIQHCM